MNRSDTPAGDDVWRLGDVTLESRLMIGTAGFPSRQVLLDSLSAAKAELVTVSVKRVGLDVEIDSLYRVLRDEAYHLLPNTAGCYTVRDAEAVADASAEALGTKLIKLEVIAEDTLLPDTDRLVEACDALVKKGFHVLPYTNDDPVVARKLEDVGCAAVMPLGAPIGSGLGIVNPLNIRLIVERATVPVILDAGVGTASDLARALEIGCDAVLLSSAISRAEDPVRMADALRHAAIAGRGAYAAGRMPPKHFRERYSLLEDRARRERRGS
jgi:thiazole synthase